MELRRWEGSLGGCGPGTVWGQVGEKVWCGPRMCCKFYNGCEAQSYSAHSSPRSKLYSLDFVEYVASQLAEQ